jgi:hypothetical protein
LKKKHNRQSIDQIQSFFCFLSVSVLVGCTFFVPVGVLFSIFFYDNNDDEPAYPLSATSSVDDGIPKELY